MLNQRQIVISYPFFYLSFHFTLMHSIMDKVHNIVLRFLYFACENPITIRTAQCNQHESVIYIIGESLNVLYNASHKALNQMIYIFTAAAGSFSLVR